jgi:hypothetical protein
MTLETEVEQIGRLQNRCVAGPLYLNRSYEKVETPTAAATEPR